MTEPALTHPGKTAGPRTVVRLNHVIPSQASAAKNTGQPGTPGQDAGPARPGGLAGLRGTTTVKVGCVARRHPRHWSSRPPRWFAAGGFLAWSPICTAHRSGSRSSRARPGGSNSLLPSKPALGSGDCWWRHQWRSVPSATACGRSRRSGTHPSGGWPRPSARFAAPSGSYAHCSPCFPLGRSCTPSPAWRTGRSWPGHPNFTVNAWGTLTYIGARACHLIDRACPPGSCGLAARPDPSALSATRAVQRRHAW